MTSIKQSYIVDGNDFISCGHASEAVKRTLKELGMPSELIRRVSIAMYEGEINMVIHAEGGVADVEIFSDEVKIYLRDHGKGIADVAQAMQEGFSTATDDIRELGFGAGMGLPNMKKYADEMVIDTKVGVGTTVYLGFKIK